MKFRAMRKLFIVLIVIGLLAVPIFYCGAAKNDKTSEDTSYGLNETASTAYGKDTKDLASDPNAIIGAVIGVILAALGIIFLIQIIIAGISWMTASGNEEKITKAKQNLIHSTIGLLIVVGAYALVNFLLDILITAVTTPSPPATSPTP